MYPLAIVAGNPAGVLRYRLSQHVIGKLLRIRCWGLDMQYFKRVSDLLCMSNLVHASPMKEHDDNDDIQSTTRRAA